MPLLRMKYESWKISKFTATPLKMTFVSKIHKNVGIEFDTPHFLKFTEISSFILQWGRQSRVPNM